MIDVHEIARIQRDTEAAMEGIRCGLNGGDELHGVFVRLIGYGGSDAQL